jgi:hypothetical protein
VNFKLKALGLAATGLMAIGMAAPAFAADPSDSTDITFEITTTDQFSVEITDSTDFQSEPFTLDPSTYNFTIQAFYDYQVTDLRGTPSGWNVNSSATEFTNTDTNATVQDAALYTGNNTQWDLSTPDGFIPATGSNPDGVSIAVSSDNIIPDGHVIIHSAAGVTPPNNQVQGAGQFSAQEALYLTFPSVVEAGTYSSTLTLTLASGDI